MIDNDNILELDYPSPNKLKGYLYTFVLYFSLILFFTTLSSYQYPNKWINNNTAHFQNLIQIQINSLITLNETDISQDINDQLNELLVKFYENRNYTPAWTSNLSTNEQFKEYFNLLDSAKYYGFPFDYFCDEQIKNLNQEITSKKRTANISNTLINLELTTTYSALKYLIYLNQGIIETDTTTDFIAYINTLPELLDNTLQINDIKNQILSVQPDLVQHQNILNSLPHFIDLHFSIKYTTPAFIDDKLLAKSLYYAGITESQIFDSTNNKSDALNKLQGQYQLRKDSLMNPGTHDVLVSLLQHRYYQACLNLHRLRKLDHSGNSYLFVNIPEFKLHVIESNEEKDVFNVIVGTKKTPTPTLTSSIEKVIANPYWTVPKSIVNNEMVYKIRKDSTYLSRNGFFIIDNYERTVNGSNIDWNQNDPLGNKYWLRQKNSRYNALGQVKFIFQNDHSVYIHDTQSKRLFKNKNRSYSHGCIRLENPDKLAQYISDKYYSENNVDIQKLISNNDRHEIELSDKVNLHIQYITCSGSENFDMVFFNDVYNLDDDEITAIFPEHLEI